MTKKQLMSLEDCTYIKIYLTSSTWRLFKFQKRFFVDKNDKWNSYGYDYYNLNAGIVIRLSDIKMPSSYELKDYIKCLENEHLEKVNSILRQIEKYC